MTDPKITALALHLDVAPDTISECGYGSDMYESTASDAPGEYMVLTDSEADAAWDASLDNYIDECILPECPAQLAAYFDHDAWKRDARDDGRGHCLSRYDGEENEQTIDGETFYIYRTN